MRRPTKAPSAGSTQGSSTLRARARRAFVIRDSSSEAKGSGAPSLGLIASLALAILALTAAPALAAEVHALSSSFGGPGHGNGQLELAEHSGLAVNQTSHDVYVADTGNGRVEQFSAAGAFVRVFGSLTQPTFVAIDNSGGASAGDVYVADSATNTVSKFEADGTLVSSWGSGGHLSGSGTPGGAFGELEGIAVNGSGDLFVLSGGKRMATFGPDGSFGEEFELEYPAAPKGFALDNSASASSGDIYTFYFNGPEVLKFDSTGGLLGEPDLGSGQGLAVDPSNGDLYVGDQGTEVARYDASGTPLETFGSPSSGQGLAVDQTNHAVYLAEAGASKIEVFTLQNVDPPAVTIEAASEVSYTTAAVSGTVDPQGVFATCHFEYVTDAHFQSEGFTGAESTPCIANPSGSGPKPVEAELSGLHPSTNYHVRLVATNPGGSATSAEPNVTFETKAVAPATVSIQAPSEVGYTTAHFSGHVNPNAPAGNPAAFNVRWHFQCTPECPGLEGEVAADNASHEVSAEASGLHPGTSYEVRLIAENAGGEASTGPLTFETEAVAKPTVSIDPVITFTATTAHFSGHVNPNAPEAEPTSPKVEGAFATEWRFRCTPECPGARSQLKADNTSHEVSIEQTGLLPGTPYEIVLFAENAGGEALTSRVTFTTLPVAPTVDSSFATEIGTSDATLGARIDPGGAATTYHFEYVTQEQFDEDEFAQAISTSESASIGSDNEDHTASATVTDLQPATAYRFQVVATNAAAPTGISGPVGTFQTLSSAPVSSGCANQELRTENNSDGLPDCRAFEKVSPSGNSAAYQEYLAPGNGLPAGITSTLSGPMQAASDGNGVTYVAEAPLSGEESEGTGAAGIGDQFLARRGASGWSATDIRPLGVYPGAYYTGFSEDLGRAAYVLPGRRSPSETPISSEVDTECPILYSRDTGVRGAFRAYYTTQESPPCPFGAPLYVGASKDRSREFFETPAARTPDAVQTPEFEGQEGRDNIYAYEAGSLHLVNVLPGANPPPSPTATVGHLWPELALGIKPGLGVDHAISDDGSHVVWTDLSTASLYVRENPTEPQSQLDGSGSCTEAEKACTVQIDLPQAAGGEAGGGVFLSASPDGSKVYFSDSDAHGLTEDTVPGSGRNLYLYDFDKPLGQRLSDLTPGALAEVRGIVGTNESGTAGSYVYFVADGAFAPGAESRSCEEAEPQSETGLEEQEGLAPPGRGCNLYVLHEGEIRLAAVLLASDQHFRASGSFSDIASNAAGAWSPILALRNSHLSADGSRLAFMSTRRLTSYDNRQLPANPVSCGRAGVQTERPACSEVYVYDAPAQTISCASCPPSGEVHDGSAEDRGGVGTFIFSDSADILASKRAISDGGSRVFFSTNEPLSPEDHGGGFDVYEWEAPGAGSCTHGSPLNGGGCVYMLSSGRDGFEASAFIDADAAGKNVFFVTATPLAANDHDGKPDIYDARVEGGFPGPGAIPPPCEGDGCRAAITPTPPSPSPPSEHFNAQESPPHCGKGTAKRHGRCVRKPRKHRPRRHKHRSQRPIQSLGTSGGNR